MTESVELPPPELEPLPDPVAGGAPSGLRGGLPPIFYRPDAHQEYYRFLFAGIVMTLGCLMPFGPEWEQAGYKTMSGALFLLMSLGLVWSMWIAVHGGRFRMNWIMLAIIPFVVQLINMIYATTEPAVLAFVKEGRPMVDGWKNLFQTAFDRADTLRGEKVGNFCRAYGTGRIVLFLGSALNLWCVLMAVFGGRKAAKAQKAARAAASPRRGGKG